jgi:HSP20 family protein
MSKVSKAENRAETPARAEEQERYLTPRVDVVETRDAYLLEAEMPGVDKRSLELSLDGNELIITGRRPPKMDSGELVYRESSPLGFRRVFELDPSIDTAKVTARMEQGVLRLTLPKADRVKPRKITVSD